MTKISVNPTPQQTRSAIADLLSEYALGKGLESITESRRKSKGKAQPAPDLIWKLNGRAVWRFHILPGPRKLRGMCPDVPRSASAIVCIDAENNVGVIDPAQLLDFLNKEGVSSGKRKLRHLAKEFSGRSLPAPDYHFKGTVQKNHQFIKDHFALRIQTGLTPIPVSGQFLQLMCDPAPHSESPRYRSFSYHGKEVWKLRGVEISEKRPFLRRPFSVAAYGPPTPRKIGGQAAPPGRDWDRLVHWAQPEFEVIYRRQPGGAGTGALAKYEAGEEIDVVGPLGKGFDIADPPGGALIVGGGIGAPPLLFLAEELVRKGVEVKVFLGALNKSTLPFQLRGMPPKQRITRFERLGLSPVICTDDGSAGQQGLVTEPLVKYLENEYDIARPTKIFACGPRPMLAALEGIANRYDLHCEALLEERMACGFGACISCVCAVKETGRKAHFTRICTEGPAFDVKKVMWHV